MTKKSRRTGCEDDADRSEQSGMNCDRSGNAPFGAESSVKHDKDQSGRADGIGKCIVVKRDFDDPVRAEDHAEYDKSEQSRYPESTGYFVEQHAGKNNNGHPKQSNRQKEHLP